MKHLKLSIGWCIQREMAPILIQKYCALNIFLPNLDALKGRKTRYLQLFHRYIRRNSWATEWYHTGSSCEFLQN